MTVPSRARWQAACESFGRANDGARRSGTSRLFTCKQCRDIVHHQCAEYGCPIELTVEQSLQMKVNEWVTRKRVDLLRCMIDGIPLTERTAERAFEEDEHV